MNKREPVFTCFIVALAALAARAEAHHSFAMFDQTRDRGAEGHGRGVPVDQPA